MNIITLSGTITADGKIKCGSGFTVVRLANGVYQITFNKPFFMKNPEVTITVVGGGSKAKAKTIELDLTSIKYFTVAIEETKMYLKDYDVNIQVVGMVTNC